MPALSATEIYREPVITDQRVLTQHRWKLGNQDSLRRINDGKKFNEDLLKALRISPMSRKAAVAVN